MRLAMYLTAATVAISAACDASANTILGIATSGGGAATHLAFTVQPATTVHGVTISPAVQVAAQNASGSADTTYVNSITVSIGTNPAAGVLSGTLTVRPVRGVATFSNLSISQSASGYTLAAAAPLLTGATSASFAITP
jgi:hypothetical protein